MSKEEKIVDGRWSFEHLDSNQVMLTNIYNGKKVLVSTNTFYKIRDGKTTVDKQIRMHIKYGVPCDKPLQAGSHLTGKESWYKF